MIKALLRRHLERSVRDFCECCFKNHQLISLTLLVSWDRTRSSTKTFINWSQKQSSGRRANYTRENWLSGSARARADCVFPRVSHLRKLSMQICYHMGVSECLHPDCGHRGQSVHLAYLRLYLNQQHRESEFAHDDDKILNCLQFKLWKQAVVAVTPEEAYL